MPTEGTVLREANAAVEVGPAGSTPSAGKPRTWGSGGAERATWSGRHPLHTQREDEGDHGTGRDSDQSQGGLEVPLHLVGTHSDASVSEGNLAADEPAGCERRGWRDMCAIRTSSRRTGRPTLGTAQGRAVPSATGTAGGHPQAWGHVRHAPVRYTHRGGSVTAARGGADSQRHLRAGLQGVLLRISSR